MTPWLRMKEQGPKEFESYWKGLQEHVGRVKAHNRKVKEEAVAYYDLRDPKVVATFFKTGNGSHLSTQPAGSFALRGEGENVFQGVYPAGVYSHLISDKHAAVMGSPRMTAAANNLWVRAAGIKPIGVMRSGTTHLGACCTIIIASINLCPCGRARGRWISGRVKKSIMNFAPLAT